MSMHLAQRGVPGIHLFGTEREVAKKYVQVTVDKIWGRPNTRREKFTTFRAL